MKSKFVKLFGNKVKYFFWSDKAFNANSQLICYTLQYSYLFWYIIIKEYLSALNRFLWTDFTKYFGPDVPARLWSASLRHGFVGCLKVRPYYQPFWSLSPLSSPSRGGSYSSYYPKIKVNNHASIVSFHVHIFRQRQPNNIDIMNTFLTKCSRRGIRHMCIQTILCLFSLSINELV